MSKPAIDVDVLRRAAERCEAMDDCIAGWHVVELGMLFEAHRFPNTIRVIVPWRSFQFSVYSAETLMRDAEKSSVHRLLESFVTPAKGPVE